MPPPRAKALDLSELRSSNQGMVPHTPNSMPGPWPVYRREFDNPQGQADHHGHSAGHYSTNPGYGLPSPRMGRTSSPWPDVMLPPASEAAPSFAGAVPDRRGNSFLVQAPHPVYSQPMPSPLSQESSSASAAVEEPQLDLQHSAKVYGSQQDNKRMQPSGHNKQDAAQSHHQSSNASRGSRLRHAVTLLFAANPLRTHREWTGVLERASPEPVVARPASPKVGALVRCLHRDFGSTSGRFVRLETLEEAYASNRKRRRLMHALRRKQAGYRSVWDRLGNDLFIIGEVAFDRCTPRKLYAHAPWWTLIVTMISLVTFAFMAAQWPVYLAAHAGSEACSQRSWPEGPRSLWDWLVTWNDCRTFSTDYLVLWGGRYGPSMTQGQNAYRWFSSLLIYRSFVQLGSNLLLILSLGIHLERRYGTRRLILLTAIAGVGGNFFSAAFEGLCHVNTGGSSAAFGMLTLFVADMAFNFEAISFPVLRILIAMIVLGTFIAAAVVQGLPARLAVLGGALTALFPSLAFLPHLKSEKFEWWQPYAAIFTTLGFCLALPLFVYLLRLPGCVC